MIVGLWRDIARDLLVVCLGDERQVRDPGLLDDYRSAVARMPSATTASGSAAPLAASPLAANLASQLRRLDSAGELLEANVRPELVLDTLLLHWQWTAE